MDITGRVGTAKIGVVTITEHEFENAKRIFEMGKNVRRYWMRRGEKHEACDVVLIRTSERFNAAAQGAVGDLIEDFRPSYIFLVGTAGAVWDEGKDSVGEAQLGDVVIADFVDYVEAIKLQDDAYSRRYVPYDHPSLTLRSDFAEQIRQRIDWPKLRKVVRHPRPGDPADPSILIGNIGCSEKILSGTYNAYEQYLVRTYAKAIAWETESYGVAYAVFRARKNPRYNPQYLTVRAISDYVNRPESDEIRKLWTPYSAGVAACFARELITALLEEIK